MKPIRSLIASLKTLNGASFASVLYTSKGSGEVARHRLLLGCNLENAYVSDIETLNAMLPNVFGVRADACRELRDSLVKSLEVGIGNNPAYTCKGVYEPIVPGMKLQVDAGRLHLTGFTVGKTVLLKGSPQRGPQSAKAKAKQDIRKGLKSSRYRQFIVDALSLATLNGDTICFEPQI